MRKKIAFILSVLLFTGCSDNTTKSNYSIGEPIQTTISNYSNSYKNGALYDSNDSIYFLNFDLMSSTPLCNKPNCDHKKSDCISKLITNDSTTSTPPIVYHDKVYYFSYNDKIVQGNNKSETTYEVDGTLSGIDLNTGEVNKICSLDDMEASSTDTLLLQDNLLYFIANNGSLQATDGTWQYFSTAGKQWICSVNLETGELTNYGRVNEDEKVDTTLFSVDNSSFGINGNVRIDGIYQNKIYMHYYYVSDQDSFLKYFEQYNTFPDSDEEMWETSYVVFDIETNKISMNVSTETIIATADHCIYWNGKQYVDESNGQQNELNNIPKYKYATIYDDIVWFSDIQRKYTEIVDLNTDKVYQLKSAYQLLNLRILAKLNDDYIVETFNDDNSISFEKVPESSLLEQIS
jgi:hypothetical protein